MRKSMAASFVLLLICRSAYLVRVRCENGHKVTIFDVKGFYRVYEREYPRNTGQVCCIIR